MATSDYRDEGIGDFNEKIHKAEQKDKTDYTILLVDFNAKLWHKEDNAEIAMCSFGYGERNDRGGVLLNFLRHRELYAMNAYLKRTSNVNGLGQIRIIPQKMKLVLLLPGRTTSFRTSKSLIKYLLEVNVVWTQQK